MTTRKSFWQEHWNSHENRQTFQYDLECGALDFLRSCAPFGSIVEVGPGSGRWSRELKNLSEAVVATDAVPACLQSITGMPVVGALGSVLPFGDKVFDSSVAIDVISVVDSPRSLLIEMARVSRQSVFITVQEPIDDTFVMDYGSKDGGVLGIIDPFPVRFYDLKGLGDLLEGTGLRMERWCHVKRKDPPHSYHPSIHTHKLIVAKIIPEAASRWE